MATFIIAVSSVVDAIRLADAKRSHKLAENIQAAGMHPTRDSDGRLHAPCDGYLWLDKVYAAGEYLADDFGCASKYVSVERFLATSEAASQLVELNVGLSVGKTFHRDGQEVCYVYGSLWSGHATAIKSVIPLSRKILSLAEDATGKTWSTTAGKLHAKVYPDVYGAICLEDLSDGLESILTGWSDHKIATGKSKKISIEIGYNYQTFIVG